MLNKFIVLAALLLPACFANAHEYKAGELEIAHPWSQELPPNAPTVAAYFVIHNQAKPPTACSAPIPRLQAKLSCTST
jgi:copper(I)-binding protein